MSDCFSLQVLLAVTTSRARWNPSPVRPVPGLLLFLSEANASYRQIFTDGQPLPEDPNPSWNGYSTGHWEGDTLVVETNGFLDGQWLDRWGSPLTDKARMTERFRRQVCHTRHRVVSERSQGVHSAVDSQAQPVHYAQFGLDGLDLPGKRKGFSTFGGEVISNVRP